ncbi:hypothetical protein ACJIZ3_014974 [Penstemon smallii]|uniref:Uncharacterized protein n=1 Tax=Penstemon smallii TaxID=265156 RepID=A0ABD3RPK1_9LAMI
MARGRSRGRSSGAGGAAFIKRGRSKGRGGGTESWEELIMRGPLSERCRGVSKAYARSIRNSDSCKEAWCKKLMVGCPEEYFDLDKIDQIQIYRYVSRDERVGLERGNKTIEEGMMSLPLSRRCVLVSEAYARSIQYKDSCFEDWCKKMMVGCPEKYFTLGEQHPEQRPQEFGS